MKLAPPLSPGAALRWAVVHSQLDGLAPRRVLEVGCGLGGFGARLAARSSYLGVEPDEQSFEIARPRILSAGGEVLHGTIDLIPPEDQFDLVCAFEVLEHLEDDDAALAAWAARVAPGGSLIVSVPAWPDRFGPSDEHVGHYRRYRPDQLDAALRRAGCDSVRHVLYAWPLGFALDAARNWMARRQTSDASMAERTLGSGRSLQPRGAVSGWAIRIGTIPFIELQRLRPTAGTGLVGVGRRGR